MQRIWTLTADMPAGQLQAIVARLLPGQIQPGITAGRHASVSVAGDKGQSPQWMTRIQQDYPGVTID